MNKPWQIPRRTFLKGVGTAIALPVLEAMAPPLRALAAAGEPGSKLFPKRMAFIYIPNGANMEDWTPKAVGTDFELPYILEPLKPLQKDFQVLSGLAHDKARASGNCDSGYSCAYQYNLSWRTESNPLPPDTDPRLVFERLFTDGIPGETAENRAARVRQRRSILDFVAEDTNRLKQKLGYSDQRKLDEYLTAVRDLELRIEQSEKFATSFPDYPKPDGIPEDNEQHLRLLFDLLALAFQTDTTRVATFLIAHDGSNRSYPAVGVSDGHHDLSHHGNDEVKKQKIAKINHFHITQFAYFLAKVKAVKEGEGSLLDNCMIVYGGAIGDGNAQNTNNLPILLAGRGGGTLQPGRHLRLERETPMTNLYLSMLDRLGVPAERIGDSTGKLENLWGGGWERGVYAASSREPRPA